MKPQSRCQAIATALGAWRNCRKAPVNEEWSEKWAEKLDQYQNALPSGSGFDSGSTIDLDRSTDKRLILCTSFHHMTEYGYYDGWTEHEIIVTPAFDGFDLRVTGRDRNGIKEYIAETFHFILSETIAE